MSKPGLEFCLILICLSAAFVAPGAARAVEVRAVPSCETENRLSVSMLNVGQGLALLITCPDNLTQTLIDAGDSNAAYPGAEELFADAFRKRVKDSHLDFAIASHPHPDHIFGFVSLFTQRVKEKLTIGTLIDNGTDDAGSELDNRIRALAAAGKTRYIDAVSSDLKQLEICPPTPSRSEPISMQLYFPDPVQRAELNCPSNYNDCSIVVALAYQGLRFIFPGDLTKIGERSYIRRKLDFGEAQVLVLGHHANFSSSRPWLDQIKPQLMLLSTGVPGQGTTAKYGHPEIRAAKRLIDYLRQTQSSVPLQPHKLSACSREHWDCDWRRIDVPVTLRSTALDGTVDLYLDGQKLCMRTETAAGAMEYDFQ